MSTLHYDADAIVVLSDIDAIRRRPTMYIGSTGADGLHQLLFELIDNAVDEFVAGQCRQIRITLDVDGSCSVRDDGRGIPVDPHPLEGRPAAEVVLTHLHSGAKFTHDSYDTSAGLHGIGLTCVNALSESLTLTIWRDGRHYTQPFVRGVPVADLRDVGPSAAQGTWIQLRPDTDVFGVDAAFSVEIVGDRCRDMAFLNPGLTIHVEDRRGGQTREYRSTNGVSGLLQELNRNRRVLHDPPIAFQSVVGDSVANVALQWTGAYAEEICSFVNNVKTSAGGTHVDALKRALVHAINRYAEADGLIDPGRGEPFVTSDVLEGLGAVVAVRMREPSFDGQIKSRLVSPDAARHESEFEQHVTAFLLERGHAFAPVLGKILNSRRARLSARRARNGAASPPSTAMRAPIEVYRKQFGIRSHNWHESCSWLTDEGLLQAHAECCDVGPDARMLDVCCGSGVVGASFGSRVAHKVGLDITSEMRALASLRLDEVKEGSVYNIPFESNSFDIVVTREVLHILPEPEKPLREMLRVLKPGGQVVIGQTVPYGTADAAWMYCIFRKKQPLFCNHLMADDVAGLLTNVGFADVTLRDFYLWESIDRWIDTHETTGLHREEIRELFRNAPEDVREVHPFEISPDGRIRDQWRWVIASGRKGA